VETATGEEKAGKALALQQVMHTVNNCEHRSSTPEFTGREPEQAFDSDLTPRLSPPVDNFWG
jgi:hypothetical protein